MEEQDLNIEIGFEELEKRFDNLSSKSKESQAKPSEIASKAPSEIMTRSKAMQMSTMGVHINDLSESIFKNVNDDDLAKSRRVPSSFMSKSLIGKLDEADHTGANDLMTKSLFVPKNSFLDDMTESECKRYLDKLQHEPIENPSADYLKPSYRKRILILLSLILLNVVILGVFLNMKDQNIKLFQDARVQLNDFLVHLKGQTPDSLEAVVDISEGLNKSTMLDELMFQQTHSGSAESVESSKEGSSFFEQLTEMAEDIIKKAALINITLQSREEPQTEVAESDHSIIWLNVGGRRFNVTQGILYNNDPSFVEFVRLSKRVGDEYWFARDGSLFEPIYSYIVLGRLSEVPRKPESVAKLVDEAKYFGLSSLSEQLSRPQEGATKKRGFVRRLFSNLVNLF